MTSTTPFRGETELLPNTWDLPAIAIPTERAPEKALRQWLLEMDELVMSRMGRVPSTEALRERADMYQQEGKSAWLIGTNRDDAALIEEDPRLYIASQFAGHAELVKGNFHMARASYVDAVREAIAREWSDAKRGVDRLTDAGELLQAAE